TGSFVSRLASGATGGAAARGAAGASAGFRDTTCMGLRSAVASLAGEALAAGDGAALAPAAVVAFPVSLLSSDCGASVATAAAVAAFSGPTGAAGRPAVHPSRSASAVAGRSMGQVGSTGDAGSNLASILAMNA